MDKLLSIDKVTQQFIVDKPIGLLDFLIDKKAKNSKNAIQSILRRKLILVNGKLITSYDYQLKKGDKVQIMKIDQSKKEKKLKGFSIVYEDKDLIVIDKNSGFLSVGTPKDPFNNAYQVLKDYVKKRSKRDEVFIVQRMERELSGLMFFVKNIAAQAKFKKNWDYMVPVMNYRGMIEGKLPQKNGTINSWLTENANLQVFSSAIDNGGIEAITEYDILDNNELYSLIDFRMKTRHRNQIRAQMHQLKIPIVGDKKYGSKTNPLKRCLLHISELTLRHPSTGKLMNFKSDLAKDATKLLKNKGLESRID